MLIAALARIVRDVGLAEELAQDALVVALEQWPVSGVPSNPGAWLMATAKNRAIDALRRNKAERKHQELGREIDSQQESHTDLDADGRRGRRSRLVFGRSSSAFTEARIALTLRFGV